MVGFPFEEGVLTPLENDRLNCGKPVVEGSKYCKEHKEYMEERQCQR